jgi:hypothetical protein
MTQIWQITQMGFRVIRGRFPAVELTKESSSGPELHCLNPANAAYNLQTLEDHA